MRVPRLSSLRKSATIIVYVLDADETRIMSGSPDAFCSARGLLVGGGRRVDHQVLSPRWPRLRRQAEVMNLVPGPGHP